MTPATRGWAGNVMTTDGLVPGDQLGTILPHEHVVLEGWPHTSINYPNSLHMELVRIPAAGGRTIVDVGTNGVGRDPAFTRRAGAKAGLQTVVATGIPKEAWQPPSLLDAPAEKLAQMMEREIVDGIKDTGIRAGLIHVAVSRWLTDAERRSLSAAGMAQRATGVAVCVDLDIGSKGSEYDTALDILADGGADLSRVAVSNLVPRPDNLELCLALAGRGCFLGFTLFGQDHRQLMGDLMDTHPDVQASSIKGFIDRGLRDRIMLSQNVDHIELMTVNGGPGYAHLLTTVLPCIRSYNVSDDEVNELMVINPGRWLAFPAR